MRDYVFVGPVDSCETGVMHITQRNFFRLSDELEIVPPHAEPFALHAQEMYGADGVMTDTARHAMEQLTIRTDITAPPHSMIRRRVK